MKRAFFVIVSLIFLLSLGCSHDSRSASENKGTATIVFETTEHDFGNIPQGGDGTYEFVFRNTGDAPLVLANVRSSCGCTIPEWPKRPIHEGKEGKIKVRYNTRIIGGFSKSITVYSNAGDTPVMLKIKGRVEELETGQ
jgi:hypothetical protein